ncbi:hypothetical protein UY3_05305 [Chelonia mydas]|uniref:Uncharacterized protein n=1 Tax=Chelonia mydas TaxID=8469 RepID=M7CA33_CHEMY|nr:hypothetical protein UY3_05305 [Chelonia mydas]
MDLFSRKIYAAGSLQLRIANQQAILSRYNFNSWTSMSKYKELLPTESRVEFSTIIEEGKATARTSLKASLDSAARTLSLGVVMRTSWLQVSGLPPEVQQTLQDLPFKGSGLFLDQTDSKLHSLKDSRATMKSLGMHTLATQLNHFKPQPQQQRQYQPHPRQDFYRHRGKNNRRKPSNLPSGQGKGPTKHHWAPNKVFEGMPEEGIPAVMADPSPCFMNRLSHFYCAWSQITSDRCVLLMVEMGYALQFCSCSPFHPPFPIPLQ